MRFSTFREKSILLFHFSLDYLSVLRVPRGGAYDTALEGKSTASSFKCVPTSKNFSEEKLIQFKYTRAQKKVNKTFPSCYAIYRYLHTLVLV